MHDFSVYSAGLDAAFEAGNVTLKELPMGGLKLGIGDVVIPAAYEGQAETAEIEAGLSALQLVSVAPDGKAAMLTDGRGLYSWFDGKLRMLAYNPQRGVEDTYGNLEKPWQNPYRAYFPGHLGDVAWSPDGRYAVIATCEAVIIRAQYNYNPHLIDMKTGDVFAVASYGRKIITDKVGGVTAACFSRDGRYAYYMVYGNIGGNRSTLIRYDIQEDKLENCCSVVDLDYYPQMHELRDGSLMIIQDYDLRRKNLYPRPGIARYMNNGFGWMRFGQSLPVEGDFPNRLQYSAESGYAIDLIESGRNRVVFQRFLPDSGFEGLNDYWAFDLENGTPVRLTYDQVRDTAVDPDKKETRPYDYEIIDGAALSPDGQYALFRTYTASVSEEKRSWQLRLVRLTDMKMIRVNGIEPEKIMLLRSQENSIEWNSGVLLIVLADGLHSFVIE